MGLRPESFGNASLSFQNLAERLRRLPGLLIADVGVAHGGADIFLAEQLLDFAKSFPTWLSRIVAALWRSPWAVISPTPRALQAARSRKLNARFENGAPEYPANTNCEAAKAIPPGAKIRRPLKFSWTSFHSRSAALKRPGTGTSWKTLPLPLIRKATISSPTLWQSDPSELNKFIEPAGGLKEGIGQVECEGGAIALLANFEVVEQSADIGKKQVVDLGLLLEGRLNLGKRVFRSQCL